jgi:hypothetical protein
MFGICCFNTACDTQGQIGATANFKTSHQILERAIDTLYAKYPDYQIPQKWKAYDNFYVRPSKFLSKKIFYFKSQPEEMYDVTLIDDSIMTGDTSQTGLAIRAINRGGAWIQQDKLTYKQQKKIQKRFNKEIIAKLKGFTKAKVEMEE